MQAPFIGMQESNGPMINMQDLMNVRESYSKKLAEEEFMLGMNNGASAEKQQHMGFMMMLAMGSNPNDP